MLRLENHLTLEEFSRECKIHLQAVYLNEMGMYPTILPSILTRMVDHYGVLGSEAEEQYQYYVFNKRFSFGEEHLPYKLPEPNLSRSPLHQFRLSLHLSTAFGFAKAIAINPTTVRRVESCKVDEFPGQLRIALRDIQVPVGDIEELEYQHQEYYHSGIRHEVQLSSDRETSGSGTGEFE
jgi:hypothetical protein